MHRLLCYMALSANHPFSGPNYHGSGAVLFDACPGTRAD